MIDLNYVAIAIIVATLCHCDHATVCSIHRGAFTRRNVNAEMSGPVIIAGKRVSISRPDKATATYRTSRTGTLACTRGTGGTLRHSRHKPLHELSFTAR